MRRSAPLLLALGLLAPASAAWGQDVYFAPFDDPEGVALKVLDECRETLDVAQYNIRNLEYLEKLRELRGRGVRIRIVVDKKNADQPYNTLDDALEAEGFQLVRYLNTQKPLAIMHLKAVVIDQQTVMTGSFNWNETAQFVNDENMLVIRDPALARAYTREIDEFFGAPVLKGPHKGDTGTEVWFSPEDEPRKAVLREIDAAQERILVAMFTFVDQKVARALVKAVEERGVEVVMVVEKKQADRFDADELVAAAKPRPGAKAPRVIVGGNVSSAHSAMHHKFAVFDGKKVITGACNWTPTAFGGSNEDLLVLSNPALARRYTEGFGALVLRYGPEQFQAAEWAIDRAEGTAHFVVHCDATQPGDEVFLIGGHPALGEWAPERAVRMRTSENMWPTWVANVRLPRGTHLEWKVLIRGPGGDRWEEVGGVNRALDSEGHGTDGAWLVRWGQPGRIEAPRTTPGVGSAPTSGSGGIVGSIPGE